MRTKSQILLSLVLLGTLLLSACVAPAPGGGAAPDGGEMAASGPVTLTPYAALAAWAASSASAWVVSWYSGFTSPAEMTSFAASSK